MKRTRLLTKMQADFIDHYMIHRKSSAAAKHAGYRGDQSANGCQILRSKVVQIEIKKRTARIIDKSRIHVSYVLDKLKEIVEVSTEKIKIYNKEGLLTGTRLVDANAANSALKIMGTHLGMFVERHEVEIKEETTIKKEVIIERDITEEAELLRQMANLGLLESEDSKEVIEVEDFEILDTQADTEAAPFSIN